MNGMPALPPTARKDMTHFHAEFLRHVALTFPRLPDQEEFTKIFRKWLQDVHVTPDDYIQLRLETPLLHDYLTDQWELFKQMREDSAAFVDRIKKKINGAHCLKDIKVTSGVAYMAFPQMANNGLELTGKVKAPDPEGFFIPREVTISVANSLACPKCRSGRLVARKRNVDGRPFFGCSEFPMCRMATQAVTRCWKEE